MPDRSDPLTPFARSLRNNATPAETRLWRALRELPREAGHRFRRQAPIGPYVADFADHTRRLVVEVDGDSHYLPGGPERDVVRTTYLERAGYTVIRFTNREVTESIEGVMGKIAEASAGAPPTPDPSPPLRGGRGMATAVPVFEALGYRLGAETRRLRAYEAPKSRRLSYLDRAGVRIRIIVPDASRAVSEAIIASDPQLAARVTGDAPLGTPGWRLTFPDPASFEAFLTAFDSRE